ncbi:MAG: aminotransferase class IV, partial [Marinirhabdus sp.]
MVNYNGTLLQDSDALLSPFNRGLHYGDTVFEVIRATTGKVLFWEDHYFRLMAAMRIMRMEIPDSFTPEHLEEQLLKTLPKNDPHKTYALKILVWRSEGGNYTPTGKTVGYLIFPQPLASPFYTIDNLFYEVELFKDHYVATGLLATVKHSNRAVNVLAGIFAKENGYANCLLLNEKKQVVGALNGNIFLVNGHKIKTPPLADGCIN